MTFSFTHEVPFVYTSKRIDAYLTEVLGGRFSRMQLQKAIEENKVFLNGKLTKAKELVKEGDRIEAQLDEPEAFQLTPENVSLEVLYEDDSILIIDKPVGMVVHPGAGNKQGTLVHALLGRGGSLSSLGGRERPGIVHRLDKDTSGILIVAKTNAAHRAMQEQFSSRSLSKTYTALVSGRVEFEEGRVLEPIGHDPRVRNKMAVVHSEKARDAESYYRVIRRFHHATLLEVRIVTGRTHQIRVHMSHLGYPIVGDVLYGAGNPGDRLCLHASKIEFLHPKSGKLMKFQSPIPKEMMTIIQQAECEKKIG